MAKKIKAIKCPQCGSTKQKKLDGEHYQCLNCGAEYLLDTDDITINHNYTYNNAGTPNTPVNKKAVGIILAVAFLSLMGFIYSGVFFRNDTTPVTAVFNKISWQRETATQVFTDKDDEIKLFIVGNVGKEQSMTEGQEPQKLYWSVYHVSAGRTEQIEPFTDIAENFTKDDIALHNFEDGSIYFVFKKTKAYQYNIAQNSLTSLNTELEKNIPQLKSGIGSIEINRNYNSLDLVSNTGAKISYFPSTKLQIQDPENVTRMPNAVLKTKYAVSNSNPNYLIQYHAMQQSGYPVFTDPIFNLSFNAQEEPVKIQISARDIEKAFIKDQMIVPTKNRMHKMLLLGYNKENVAIAFKDNISEGEKYNIQLLDAKGKVQWNLNSGMGFIDPANHLLSAKNELFITVNNAFYLIGKSGTIEKRSTLETIVMKPKD